MEELDITDERIASIWWSMLWRQFVGIAIVVTPLWILRRVLETAGVPPEAVRTVVGILLFLGQLVVMFASLRLALRLKYQDFRIALLPRGVVGTRA